MAELIFDVFKQGIGLWKYFLRSIGDRVGEFGKCIVEGPDGEPCNRILSLGKKKSPTTLQNHLIQVHKINYKRPNDGSDEEIATPKRKKDSIELVMSRMTALDGVSFRLLANSHDIRRAFTSDGYAIPESANTIRELVLRFASGVRQDMTKKFALLKAAGCRFSLTMDEWTSIRGRRYANVNLHSDGQTFCLGLVRCIGSMVAERCGDLVRNLLTEYGLVESDIVAITTDGAKVMVKMGRQLPFIHQLCMAHGLHLAVMDVLYSKEAIAMVPSGEVEDREESGGDILAAEERDWFAEEEEENDGAFQVDQVLPNDELQLSNMYQLKSIVSKVRDVVNDFHLSALKRDALDSYTLADHGRRLGPIGDCKTRWNSTLNMLKRFLIIRLSIVKSLADVGASIHFDDIEVESLNVITGGLHVVQETLTELCGRSVTLLKMDAALTCLLNSIVTTCPFGAALYAALVARINKRRTIASNVMQYLHNGGINGIHPEFKTNTRAQMEKFVVELWTRTNPDQLMDVAVIEDEVPPPNLNFKERMRKTIQDHCAEPEVPGVGQRVLKKELIQFRKSRVRGPILERLYIYLKSIPATSVEAERNFSTGGRFCSKLRSRLGDVCLSALTMLHFYFKSLEN